MPMNDSNTQTNTELVAVPWQSVSEDALLGLLEEYISRDGTDYGLEELTLEQKVGRAKRQLENGHVVIVVDLTLESTHIISAEEYNQSLAVHQSTQDDPTS